MSGSKYNSENIFNSIQYSTQEQNNSSSSNPTLSLFPLSTNMDKFWKLDEMFLLAGSCTVLTSFKKRFSF